MKQSLVRSNDTCYIGDVRRQITNLKAQFLQLHIQNPMLYNDETYVTAVKMLCNRVAKHFGLKFNKKAENLKDEINLLISKLPKQEQVEESEVGLPETQSFVRVDDNEKEVAPEEGAVEEQSGS